MITIRCERLVRGQSAGHVTPWRENCAAFGCRAHSGYLLMSPSLVVA